MPQVLYIPHGGGPLPIMGDPGHDEMVSYLSALEAEIGRPKAIVVVSAHWESPTPTITAGANPDLYFDYYGFPPETYELEYPALGSPELAQQIADGLRAAGLEAQLDTERGFDHGMFVPLMLMFPDAAVPVVQLSLLDGLDPEAHIELGEALAKTLDDDVLVLGSGMSYHNMAGFSMSGGPVDPDPDNEAFDEWLEEVCSGEGLDSAERRSQLVAWEVAPAARVNHPREEHLLPLHVCFGVGGGKATRTFTGQVLGKKTAAYSW